MRNGAKSGHRDLQPDAMGVVTRLAAGHLREAGIVAFLANQPNASLPKRYPPHEERWGFAGAGRVRAADTVDHIVPCDHRSARRVPPSDWNAA
jgi:hypothetical protein